MYIFVSKCGNTKRSFFSFAEQSQCAVSSRVKEQKICACVCSWSSGEKEKKREKKEREKNKV